MNRFKDVAGRSAEIDPHAGRQVHHQLSRSTLSTARKVAASAPDAMRSLSPGSKDQFQQYKIKYVIL